MKALIAIDATESSWDAVEFAKDFLRDDDQAVILNVARHDGPATATPNELRSLRPRYYGRGRGAAPLTAADLILADPARNDPAGVQRPAATFTGQAVDDAADALDADETVKAVGDPVERIVATAEEIEADLIVVGTRDRGAVERFFSGSVSRDVVDKAPCSVLVVK